jgi:hypothetical protein
LSNLKLVYNGSKRVWGNQEAAFGSVLLPRHHGSTYQRVTEKHE